MTPGGLYWRLRRDGWQHAWRGRYYNEAQRYVTRGDWHVAIEYDRARSQIIRVVVRDDVVEVAELTGECVNPHTVIAAVCATNGRAAA